MTTDLSDDFLNFSDEIHTPASVVAAIRQNLAHSEFTPLPEEMPTFSSEANANIGSLSSIADHLEAAARLMAEVDVAPTLAPSPATQLPIIGQIWSLIREQVHQMPLFYVNRRAAKTVQANAHLKAAINELAAICRQQQEAIESLQKRLES